MNAQPKLPEPESPAKITFDHVQDRVLNTRAGAQVGWRKLSPLQKAHERGQLVDKWKCKGKESTEEQVTIAVARYEAGKRFAAAWLMSVASWPSGSDLNRVRVVGVPGSFADHAIDEKKLLRSIEAHMSPKDYMIVRKVCGEEHAIGQTVASLSPAYGDSTLARFREALDALIEALETVRRA